ncbi:MAG: hypothetical protein WAV41_02540 [Microgenomates group bacterium]
MNENTRNTRTLIVSFVFAIMALIPLRFVEAGQNVVLESPQVLGEETMVVEETQPITSELEAPYNEIEAAAKSDCIMKEDAEITLKSDQDKIVAGGLSGSEIDDIVAEMIEVEANTCK